MKSRGKIAERITEIRKAHGITIKELAARTEVLSAARISNWEQGTRNPGPAEAMMLGKVLNVSASYLLCISDDPRGDLILSSDVMPKFIPILEQTQAKLTVDEIKEIIQRISCFDHHASKVVLDTIEHPKASANCFAIRIEDMSMSPAFVPGDLVIVDLERLAQPGDFVLAVAVDKVVLRKYREQDANQNMGQLIALNPDWGAIQITANVRMLASVIEHRRVF